MGRLNILLITAAVTAVTVLALSLAYAADSDDESRTVLSSHGVVYGGITVYTDEGISVEITEEHDGSIVLTAITEGDDTFIGWYDSENSLLSSDTVYKVSSGTVFAYSASYTTAESGTDPEELLTLSGGTLTVTDSDGESSDLTETGLYYAAYTDSENGIYRCFRILVDGYVSVTYEWSYSESTEPVFGRPGIRGHTGTGSASFSLTLDILYSDYLHYTGIYSPSERICYYTNHGGSDSDIAHDTSFVSYDSVQDPYISQIAEYILSVTEGKSEQYRANVLLAFVQNIEYVYDSDIHGTEEYWQFPLETLFLGSGDCEDTSILFCAIASAMGYDSAMLLFDGHMAAGIAVDGFRATRSYSSVIYRGANGWTLDTENDGVTTKTVFYYGETTTTGWLLGEIPSSVYRGYLAGFVISAS